MSFFVKLSKKVYLCTLKTINIRQAYACIKDFTWTAISTLTIQGTEN